MQMTYNSGEYEYLNGGGVNEKEVQSNVKATQLHEDYISYVLVTALY